MISWQNVVRSVLFLFFLLPCPLMAQENPVAVTTQAILEPHMVQIILNDEHRQGVDWEAIVSDFHPLVLKKENDADDTKNKLSIGVISDEDYVVLLDALDAVGQVTQSTLEPVTLALDTKTNIDFPFSDVKNKISIAAQLSVSPKGVNQLIVSPVIQSKTASTTIDLKVNTTVVLGSIFSEHEVTKTHKFPLLGDLPIVGLVFRNKGKLMQKIETIIFLSSKG